MKKKMAVTILATISMAFVIGSTVILYNSGGWEKVAFFWLLLASIMFIAGLIVWCINQIES